MRIYTLSVNGADAPSYNDPLKFTTDSMDEVIRIIELMLKNGHRVSVLCEEKEPADPSDEFVDAVAEKVTARIGKTEAPFTFDMDETGAAKVEALAG